LFVGYCGYNSGAYIYSTNAVVLSICYKQVPFSVDSEALWITQLRADCFIQIAKGYVRSCNAGNDPCSGFNSSDTSIELIGDKKITLSIQYHIGRKIEACLI